MKFIYVGYVENFVSQMGKLTMWAGRISNLSAILDFVIDTMKVKVTIS